MFKKILLLLSISIPFCLAEAKNTDNTNQMIKVIEQMAKSRDFSEFEKKFKLLPPGEEIYKVPLSKDSEELTKDNYREGIVKLRNFKKYAYIQRKQNFKLELPDKNDAYLGVYLKNNEIQAISIIIPTNSCGYKENCRKTVKGEFSNTPVRLTRITNHCKEWEDPEFQYVMVGWTDFYKLRFKHFPTELYLENYNNFFRTSRVSGEYNLTFTYEKPNQEIKDYGCY